MNKTTPRYRDDNIPSFPAIAEGTSAPCDPTALSFLTTFPAEIRNAVYNALFHVPGGIRVSPSWEYVTGDTFEDQELRKDLVAGLPILSTCRQIYQEAATTLFSNNTWIVSRDLDQMKVRDGTISNGTMTEAAGAVEMLQDFGSRKVMVREILLDLDRACPVPCTMHRVDPVPNHPVPYHESEHALEMWSLVKAMLHLPHLKVEFMHPKRQAYYDFHPSLGAVGIDIGIQLDVLNATFHTLRRDAIGIRRYGKQVQWVYIQRDCSEGNVIFQSSVRARMEARSKLRFTISEEGRNLTWKSLERTPPSLLGLPGHIKDQIIDDVSFVGCAGPHDHGPEIIWDVDRRTLTGATLLASEICKVVRTSFFYKLWLDKKHVLKMGTSELRADFGKFQSLQRLRTMNLPFPHWTGNNKFGNLGVSLRLLLEFRVPPEVALEDVYLNITNLLQITASFVGGTKITVSVTRGEDVPVSETTTNLYMCRALALSALSEVGQDYSQGFSQDTYSPAIWMNGRFEVVETDVNDRTKPLEDAYL